MRRCLALALCLAVNACSRLPELEIINNSGTTIEIVSAIAMNPDGFEVDVRAWPDGYEVRQGQVTDVFVRDMGGAWRVQLKRNNCTLWYVIPHPLQSLLGTAVQLQPNHNLYLVTSSAMSRDRQLISDEQFPVAPASNSCVLG